MPRLRRFLPLSLLAAVFCAATPASAARRIDPSWVLDGPHSVAVQPGFASLVGAFSFSMAGGSASLNLNYDDHGRLAGSGFAAVPDPGGSVSVTNYVLVGTYSVDSLTGEQAVHLVDSTKSPAFVFDGTVSPDANDLVGTFQRRAGFLGIAGEDSGPLTIHRTSGPARTTFLLAFTARMDARGHVRGALAVKSETTGEVTVYGTRLDAQRKVVDVKVTRGKIRGLVKTDKYAVTTAKLTIAGRGWKAALAGPVDQDGFHAAFGFVGAGFKVHGAAATLAVRVGAPPPIPPPPKNLLTGAVATIVNGKLTITHTSLPSKFFGVKAQLSIEIPATDAQAIVNGHSIVHADPAHASLPDPDARRCTVTISGRDYGTATAPADVTIDVHRILVQIGGEVEALATGTVVASNGTRKSVNVLVVARLQ